MTGRSLRILVAHGPNLNLLGRREPDIYGQQTLSDIEAELRARASRTGVEIVTFQSNHEGELIDRLQATLDDQTGAVLLNPGGLTHTSVSLRDTVAALVPYLPVIEVHISIPEAREPFRHSSLVAGVVSGRVSGFGPASYLVALEGALYKLQASRG